MGLEDDIIKILVFVGEVVFDNIYSPISIQVIESNNWVVAMVGENSVKNVLKKENNVPLIGMEHDAVPRDESYIKDFISLNLGTIHWKPGKGTLKLMRQNLLKANDLDIKLVTLRRIN